MDSTGLPSPTHAISCPIQINMNHWVTSFLHTERFSPQRVDSVTLCSPGFSTYVCRMTGPILEFTPRKYFWPVTIGGNTPWRVLWSIKLSDLERLTSLGRLMKDIKNGDG
jgi:hypothetical protein